MALLTSGLLLFALVHLAPALRPALKERLVARFGKQGYRGLFSLLVLAGVVLIVLGWRGVEPVYIFAPPPWARPAGIALVAVAFWLFAVASRPSALKRRLRHPQLTGFALFALAHVLVNGDNRSLLLFTGLGLWALLEIAALERRDGRRAPAPGPGALGEAVTVALAAGVFALVAFGHPWFTGMPVW